jgi:hypothetical protein
MEELPGSTFAMTLDELKPIVRRRFFRPFLVLAGTYSLVMGLAVSSVTNQISGWLATPIAFLALLALFALVTIPRQMRLIDKLMLSNREVVLTEHGCSWTYESGLHTYVPWDVFRKAEVYKGIYLLYIPGGNFLMLPRRALSTDQEHFLVERLRSKGLLTS